MADTMKWLSHEFYVLSQDAAWNPKPGVYIFCGLTPQNRWKAYYVGQADTFQDRIPSHEQWDEAVRLGATHVHAMVVQEQASRDRIEAELIRALQPPLNTQLR